MRRGMIPAGAVALIQMNTFFTVLHYQGCKNLSWYATIINSFLYPMVAAMAANWMKRRETKQ
jgi:hypothetical protein